MSTTSAEWRGLRQRPRRYQLEAFEWAYREERAVVVLPTGTGKTLVAVMWAKRLLDEGKASRVLFLEPTRFLVEQAARYIRWVSGLPAEPVHGAVPPGERRRRWRSRVVVATPEAFVAEMEEALEAGPFDALVVDECHHTTGKDAYLVAVRRLASARYRLGLSAYIPRSRRRQIEETIGRIREWSWSSPDVAPYIPPWIGEVYEAEMNEEERRLYEELERAAEEASGRLRGLLRNALRWLARDGALALRDSAERATTLAEALRRLRGLIYSPGVRPSHKMPALERVLADHEGCYTKAIVFIDRVVVAEYACSRLASLGLRCALIRGRMRGAELRRAIEEASKPSTRVIVATSAGEEGVDLPEADLLVMWSISASPLRFIQRHGRVLRAREGAAGRPRSVAYIVTPETVDVDSFIDAVEAAEKAGVDVPVSRETLEALWRRSERSRILSALEGSPAPLEALAEYLGVSARRLEADLRRLAAHGDVVYIYTGMGRIYAYSGDLELLEEAFPEYLSPEEDVEARARYRLRSGGEGSARGRYRRLLERLSRIIEERGPLERLTVSLQVDTGRGLVRLVNLVYSFLIDTREKLELVLRNAFSTPRIVRELGTVPA